tara:strand:- start:765 stop:983 length:219 start_codon:yes stop_codon:yes gene_type:complete
MKSLYNYLFVFLFFSCNSVDPEPEAPCEIEGIDGVVCIEVYEPVCGCDNVTYSNSCYAQNSVSSWTEGECSG